MLFSCVKTGELEIGGGGGGWGRRERYLTLFDMGFFELSVIGGGGGAS